MIGASGTPDKVDAIEPETCSACGGSGSTTYIDGACCGNYLASGECCAALYGSDRLVPVEQQEPCGDCNGTGVVWP